MPRTKPALENDLLPSDSDQQLEFERLIASLPSQVGAEITGSLRSIVNPLDLGRSRSVVVSRRMPSGRLSSWMMSSLAVLVLLGSSLSGCAALFVENKDVPEATREQIAKETARYLKKGSGSISGVVKIETSYGGFLATSGTEVMLTPATTVAVARFQEFVVEKNELPEQRQAELLRFSRTDAAGRFKFLDLPSGEYLLASPVAWSPSGNPSDARSEVTYARVTLTVGQKAEVTVTRNIQE